MSTPKRSTRNEGLALVSSLIILFILTSLGLTGIYLASMDLKIAGNYRIYKQKFYTAEAALERGVNRLKNTSTDIWRELIEDASATHPEQVLFDMNQVAFQGMNYTVLVKNNFDDPVFDDANFTPDQKYSTETDHILVLIGEGSNNKGRPIRLQTAVAWTPQEYNSYGGRDITTENTNVSEVMINWE